MERVILLPVDAGFEIELIGATEAMIQLRVQNKKLHQRERLFRTPIGVRQRWLRGLATTFTEQPFGGRKGLQPS